MIGNEWKKLLTIFCTILPLNFMFFTFASAKDLNMVMKKGDTAPKLSSRLGKLKKEYEKRAIAAQAYDPTRDLKSEFPEKITLYLISEEGTMIDKGSLQPYGAEIIKSDGNVWKVRAPFNMIEAIADNLKGISFIKLPDRAKPSDIQSEGLGLTGATNYHSVGHTGSGVKVAVIDIGFAGLSSAISAGELPNTVVMIDCTGSSCISTGFSSETDYHGTAVAEIVYDMAPGAELYLIKIGDTLDLKDAKDYAVANGIKIINHSVGYWNTNFYGGGCYNSNAVCTANDAHSNGILWVNSMGNYAESHYGATFTDSDGDGFHDVAAGDDETINIEASAGDIIDISLTWDAWPTTDQDYDLGLYDSDLNLVASSETIQTGTQPPTEAIYYSVTSTDTYHVAILKYNATSNHRLAVFSFNHGIDPAVASNSIVSPADAITVMAVGAIDYENWITGPQESFSSQGPTSDGRTKPEISGPDNVTSYIYGSFPGTSAASPYVAGAAALILSRNPTYSVSQLWDALKTSTVDMGSSGQDNIYGYGRLNLPPADSDEDGIDDSWEIQYFGNLTTATNITDSDGDGLLDRDEYANETDPINIDSDEDGMTDGWEVTYGLNPLFDDSSGDPDADGYSNLEEYNQGRHPFNVEPDTPILSLPTDTEAEVSLTPELHGLSYVDADGDNHVQTRWQISTVENDFTENSLVLNIISDQYLTAFRVPELFLDINTTYYWRITYYDDRGAASEWSSPFSFTTIITDETDVDQNGIPDDQEIDDPLLDLDGDATPDINQADMVCVSADFGNEQIGIKRISNVTSIESISWTDTGIIAETINRPDELPLGLISFKLLVSNPGDTAEITIYSNSAMPNSWFKYDSINGWQDFSSNAIFSSDNKSVTLTITDGGHGDCDGVANGIIVDPSGPGVTLIPPSPSSVTSSGGGGGGGCLISASAYGFHLPKKDFAIIFLFSLLLIFLSVLRKEAKK